MEQEEKGLPKLRLDEAIITCFKKYATFSGRARRSEFWWWTLFAFVVCITPYVGGIAVYVLFLPSLSVSVRRMHDIGKSDMYVAMPYGFGAIGHFLTRVLSNSDGGAGFFLYGMGQMAVLIAFVLYCYLLLPMH